MLDSLVAAGVELDRAIAFKYCAPSRCALYSGRNPAHVNVDNDVFASGTGIPENMTTLATKLKLLAGYRTVFAGKCVTDRPMTRPTVRFGHVSGRRARVEAVVPLKMKFLSV